MFYFTRPVRYYPTRSKTQSQETAPITESSSTTDEISTTKDVAESLLDLQTPQQGSNSHLDTDAAHQLLLLASNPQINNSRMRRKNSDKTRLTRKETKDLTRVSREQHIDIHTSITSVQEACRAQQNEKKSELNRRRFTTVGLPDGKCMCSICKQQFVSRAGCWRHALRNHTTTAYECTACHLKFSRSDTLAKHLKRYCS